MPRLRVVDRLSQIRRVLPLIALTGVAASAQAAEPAAMLPLQAEKSTRRLLGANGTPFFVSGDAAWSLIVQLTREEAVRYLDDRRSRGFNTLLVNLIEHYYSNSPPANRYGNEPFLVRGDFSTPNETYFAHVDWILDQAAQRGMVILLAPVYLGNGGNIEGWYQELKANGVAKCRQFGRYLGQRYASSPSIVWVHGGDAPPMDGLPEIEALVAGIKEFDGNHLHTAHSRRTRSAIEDYDRPWLELNTTYTDNYDCSGPVTASREDFLHPPTFFHIEGWYEAEGASTSCLLGQMYYPPLLGSRGHVFGNRPMWLFDPGWQSALGSAGAKYMTYSAALFRSREGWGLIPDIDRTIVSSGEGDPNGTTFAAAARTPSGASVLVYVPTARTIGIDTTEVPGSSFVAWWFDPRTGTAQQIGTFARGGNRSFTTPGGSPWVLVLDDASATLAAPGGLPGPWQSDIPWHHHGTGMLYRWFMNGTTQIGGSCLNPCAVSDPLWQVARAADLDGDGHSDLFWRHLETGQIYVWLMNGIAQTAGASLGLVPDLDWRVAGTGDFSGDGHTDILWHHQVSGSLYVWNMTGTTLIGQTFVGAVPDTGWRVVGTGDLNGDRHPDILWRHQQTGQVYAWLMNGIAQAAGASLGLVPDLEWKIVGSADFSGDGQIDILWHHLDLGLLAVWIMEGTAVNAVVPVTPDQVAETMWRPVPF